MEKSLFAIGIDIGASAVKISLLTLAKENLCHISREHKGRPYAVLAEEIDGLALRFKLQDLQYGALTGVGGLKLAAEAGLKNYPEVQAQCAAVKECYPRVGTIVELGCQNSKFIALHPDKSVKHFSFNTDCSAGTGSFLEEQALRLGIDLCELSGLTERASSVPRIAGRCSVFAKTDIVHLQQEGRAVSDILSGLCYAVIRTFKASVVRSARMVPPLLLHGGMTENKGIVRAVRELFSLGTEDIFIPGESRNMNSSGTALLALAAGDYLSLSKLKEALEQKQKTCAAAYHRPLVMPAADTDSLHQAAAYEGDCYLGIDVGSTSTNLVLMTPAGRVVDLVYLRTAGDPIAAVRQGLQEFKARYHGERVLGVGVTGSGRYLIGGLVGGDVVADEIFAQARAAVEADPEADTVFEIGGQDAKFIRLENGVVTGFEMNKVCAAGTGSFLEEQAKKLGITAEEIAPLAFSSSTPVSLGERCTVCMDTNVRHHLALGTPLPDIVSGLCYAVAQNYLNRVVGFKKIGAKINFQGGVAFNRAVLAALQNITGRQITVSPFFSVTGAWGAALQAREQLQGQGLSSKFHGWEAGSGGCGARGNMFDKGTAGNTEVQLPPLFALREALFMKDYRGKLNPEAPTVGIPRVLYMYKLFPMFQAMFHYLGYNVVISGHTDERIVGLSESVTYEETCFPVKLIAGHVLDLLEKNVDYIFLPALATMKHQVSRTRQDYPCIFMQSAAKIIEVLLGSQMRQKNVKLISPVLSFKFGRQHLLKTFLKMGAELGKSAMQLLPAIKAGFLAKDAFEQAVEKAGREFLRNLSPDEKALVLITRPYGIIDRHLNMRIPQELAKMGIKIIPKDALPIADYDVSDFCANMYWPFGQHILAAVQIAREHPNLYPVFITNHGCGPDTALTHYVSEIMGDKPYLHLEVDEHSSPVGIITRLEAFISSLNSQRPQAGCVSLPKVALSSAVSAGKQLFLPDLGPHATALSNTLGRFGYKAQLLEPPQEEVVEAVRSFTTGKECFSLTALLGSVVTTLTKEKERLDRIAILIPALEGAEVDGQYARLLKTFLNKQGLTQVEVVAPFLEDLFTEKSLFEPDLTAAMFRMIFAVDVLSEMLLDSRPYTDDPAMANHLFAGYLQQLAGVRDLKAMVAAAGADFARLATQPKTRPLLALVGEPYLLYRPELNANLVESAERLGAQIKLAPLAEVIYHYLSEKQAEAKAKKELFIYLRYRSVLGRLSAEAEQVFSGAGKLLQQRAEKITRFSKEYLPCLYGGFGMYRIGKAMLAREEGAHAIINVASLYENTALLTNIFSERFKEHGAWLNIGIDGKKNENDEMRLQTFVHNLPLKKENDGGINLDRVRLNSVGSRG
ncbi:MAG: Activator of (R)-2-hydroxyglutaryl-CoA dehydratase [Syntrophomonadaceae bacterium]|nr:Activator of (R)-2-hydroxyglutaryl-CoA dehydratase [Bacillota bacterium]